jgi:hypothetical protein
MYYDNFGSGLFENGKTKAGTLIISYPTNGTGYDNFIYSYFFGTAYELGELMDDTTRALKETIEGFYTSDEVSSWLTLEVNDKNTSMVQAFADAVKEAHATYNLITSATQLEYLKGDNDNIAKLSAIESALKDVKTRFGIKRTATSLKVSSDSKHKTSYKEGDKFSLSGLKLIVVYDDYTEEEADMSKISLRSAYDRELITSDRSVGVTGYGLTVYIPVTVTEASSSTDNNNSSSSGGNKTASGCGSVTTGGFDGGMMALAIGICALAIAAKTIIARRKKED